MLNDVPIIAVNAEDLGERGAKLVALKLLASSSLVTNENSTTLINKSSNVNGIFALLLSIPVLNYFFKRYF